jgi:hypothetical protein
LEVNTMNAKLLKSGAIAAAALLATSCAVRQPLAPHTADSPTQTLDVKVPGDVTVPLTLPALPERSVQFAYDRNYINTVEVRLRDSLGNESVQYVARNAYLSGSTAAGTVNVRFHNVMPGVFNLTVRSSHERLLADTGRIAYDGLRDVFFRDGDGDETFDPGETEMRVIAKSNATSATSPFIVFDAANIDVNWVFPASLRTDVTATHAGFGTGGATQSITPGTTTTVAVTVGQVPQWNPALLNALQTVTAGEPVVWSLKDGSAVQASDMLLVNGSAGVTAGIVDAADFDDAKRTLYKPTTDAVAGTVTFTPTVATHPDAATPPTAWPVWMARGQAVSEMGVSAMTAPRLIVHPAIVTEAQSRIHALDSHVSAGGVSALQYDLRDAYGNRVAGNVANVNAVSLGSAAMANSELAMDYAVVASSVANGADLAPFLLPGRTKGRVNGAGDFSQGSEAAALFTEPATYSALRADAVTVSPFKLLKLDIPHHLYEANLGSFGGGAHDYVLNISDDLRSDDPNFYWLALQRVGGPTIASASAKIDLTTTRSIALEVHPGPEGVEPTPLLPTTPPVLLWINKAIDPLQDDGTVFTVTDYGKRRYNDTDTVRVRVRRQNSEIFTKDVMFGWSN